MTRVLVATASVHTTAAACDYLEGRLDGDDTVVVLTVEDDTVAGRDAGDAANVARTRLFEPTIEPITGEGEPATEIQVVAEQEAIDEIVLGQVRGDPLRTEVVKALVDDPERGVEIVLIGPSSLFGAGLPLQGAVNEADQAFPMQTGHFFHLIEKLALLFSTGVDIPFLH